MTNGFQGPRWYSVLTGLAIILGTLYLVSGLLLAHTLVQCLRSGGHSDWANFARAALLLLCLPLLLLGLKRAGVSSILLICGAMVAAVLAISQKTSAVNLRADSAISLSMFLIGWLLYRRSAWKPKEPS